MKKLLYFSPVLILAIGIASCKKDKETPSTSTQTASTPSILSHSISVENIIASDGNSQSTTNNCFINLYDGQVYNLNTAIANSDKVDFAYNYHGGGCSSCRFFENVKNMSTRTSYVSNFSSYTDSKISNAGYYYGIRTGQFDSLKTASDINTLFNTKDITSLYGSADVTDRTTDVATGKVFAFKDKNGKLGFFKIGNYTANVPNGDKATLTIDIKIIK